MKYVGIDYSMSSPGLCIITKPEGTYELVSIYTFNSKFKYKTTEATSTSGDRFVFYFLKNPGEGLEGMKRYLALGLAILNEIDYRVNTLTDEYKVAIEGYSMASHGRIFDIAENTAILKYLLYTRDYQFTSVAPTTLKKFATGNGKSGKELMYGSFLETTGIDIRKTLNITRKIGSPETDAIDAYWLARYGQHGEKDAKVRKVSTVS